MPRRDEQAFWEALEYAFPRSGLPNRVSLAAAAGVSHGTVYDLFNRRYAGKAALQEKIAKAFGYSLIDFLALGQRLLEAAEARPTAAPVAPASRSASISLPPHDASPLKPKEREALECALLVLRSPGVRGSPDKLLLGALKAARELLELVEEGEPKPVVETAERPVLTSAAG